MQTRRIIENIKKYRFEFRHLTVLFLVLIVFQFILSYIQKSSLTNFLVETQNWYQQYSAEKMANLTSTSLELLLENIKIQEIKTYDEKQKIIQSFNIIFSQQLLQQNVEDICLLVTKNGNHYAIDDGQALFDYLTGGNDFKQPESNRHELALSIYNDIEETIKLQEQINSILEGVQTFHIFVPFVPNGEFQGALYIRKTPDFTNITDEIISSYDEAAIIYSSLILLGLLAMYYISSFTVKERDQVQRQLYEENEKHIKEQIIHEKESLFTRRIYHTHHKAEKVMGYIKEDLRNINDDNFEEIKYRVTKYSNFISRVIYDMKWFDPPLNTIRNQAFNTDVNELIEFLVKHIFLRISSATDIFMFQTNLDRSMPKVHINEYVVWEILEPLLQNGIDHAGMEKVIITIRTVYDKDSKQSFVFISDNGQGIREELLKIENTGVKRIFSENVSTKFEENRNTGYGCYIAHELATKRCGWKLDVYNKDKSLKGCEYKITIPNYEE